MYSCLTLWYICLFLSQIQNTGQQIDAKEEDDEEQRPPLRAYESRHALFRSCSVWTRRVVLKCGIFMGNVLRPELRISSLAE